MLNWQNIKFSLDIYGHFIRVKGPFILLWAQVDCGAIIVLHAKMSTGFEQRISFSGKILIIWPFCTGCIENIKETIMFIVISLKHHNFIIFLLFNLAVIIILPPPSIAYRIINIRELNSCLVADVCCCCTLLSAPGGERSTQGCRVKQRFSRRRCMLMHWKKKTNKQMSICLSLSNRCHQIKISIIDCSI